MEFKSSANFGNISEETAKFLQSLISAMKISSILEIGSSNGYSSYMFSRVCKKIRTIELSRDRIIEFRKNKKLYGNPAELIEGDALEILPRLAEKFDLVFIDGMKKQYLSYFRLALPITNKIIVADNVLSHKCEMADFLKEIKNHDSVILGIGSGLALITK